MNNDTITQHRNPNGGRAAGIGSLQVGFYYGGKEYEVRYHLGYCPSCNVVLRATRDQAQKIVNGLKKEFITPKTSKESFTQRVLLKLMPSTWRQAINEQSLAS